MDHRGGHPPAVALAGFDLDTLVAAGAPPRVRAGPTRRPTSLRLANTITHGETANVLGCSPGATRCSRTRPWSSWPTTTTSGSASPTPRATWSTTAPVDNATGVAQVLAIAKAFMALPQRPRRTILFAIRGCEESGLLGSAYYTAHPTFPIERIAADINFDAGNIFGKTRDVALVGKGKSTLDQVAKAVAALQGRVVIDEPFPDHGIYYRSDHFSFARAGVPGLYFKGGLDFVGREPGWGKKVTEEWGNAHYHQPSDEYGPSWNFDGMIEDTQLGFLAGLAVAQADAMPTWLPGDEFAKLRARPRPQRSPSGQGRQPTPLRRF